MEKFVITGSNSDKVKFEIAIPKAKHFEVQAVFKGEKLLRVKHVINDAVQRKHKTFGFSTYGHIKPSILEENGSRLNLPKSLQQILARHPLPLSQGPVLLPLDTDTEDQLSIGEVLHIKTCFSHKDSQPCSEWFPESIGGSGWGDACFEVRELPYSVEGAASTRSMGLVYTCTGHKCAIHCPCTICTDPNAECKLQCRTEVCHNCNSQCQKHKIELPRVFNSDSEHFTMVTMKMDSYQFATPHAGIPLNCLACSENVMEHQVFHLVFHTRCRFCRQELQRFERRSIVTKRDYKSVDRFLQGQENRTCSFCLKKFFGITARRKHEEHVHQGKEKEFKCDRCDKTYSNNNALNYHKTTNHEKIISEFNCDICGTQFSTSRTLLRHQRAVHGEDEAKFACPECDVKLSREDAFMRHKREKHFDANANIDFVEDLASLTSISCASCSSTFKRKSDLKRHPQAAHAQGKIQQFKCSLCEKMTTLVVEFAEYKTHEQTIRLAFYVGSLSSRLPSQ